jgi:imidazolonepropionase-like amidohydrolase
MSEREILIKAKVLFDGKQKLENKIIEVQGNIISNIQDADNIKADYEGIVTPAFIDAHSHIGMDREGEPWQESETNDVLDQFNPLNDPMNSIYFDDRAFKDAVDFGVLYSCVVPGSGNLIGGRSKIIRNYAKNRKDALLVDHGFKMALGFNPRSTLDWKGKRPNTRMGVYALLEQKLDDVLQKREKNEIAKQKKMLALVKKRKDEKINEEEFKEEQRIIDQEYKLEFSSEEMAYYELLTGEKTAKVHVHKEDDVYYLIHLVDKYKIKVTAEHTCDVFNQSVFEDLAEHDIPIVYGPLGSVGYKVELKHAYYQNAKMLMESKAKYGLMTDHPVIHTIGIRDSLKFFMIHGMSEEDAISLITLKNAQILGIDNVLGSLEANKIASLTVWNDNPLHLRAYPKMVMGEGRILRG